MGDGRGCVSSVYLTEDDLECLEKARVRMRQAAFTMSGMNPEMVMRQMDKDGNGEIDLAEFKNGLRTYLKIGVTELPDSHASILLQALDADGGGTLDMEELLSFIKASEPSDPSDPPAFVWSVSPRPLRFFRFFHFFCF